MNNSVLQGLLIFTILLGLVWVAKSIVLPLLFAFILWVIITSWHRVFSKIKVFKKTIPHWLQTTLSLVVFIFVVTTLSNFLANDLNRISVVYPVLQKNMQVQARSVEDRTGFNLFEFIEQNFTEIDIPTLAQNAANRLSSVFGTIFTTLIYLVFIFGEQKYFQRKLKASSGEQYEKNKILVDDILSSIQQYISIKTAMSALTAGLSYAVFSIIGLEFPFVWAFIIFVLNFIPSIGSLIATAFPAFFAFLTFGLSWQPLVVLVCIGAIQMYVGNILEPRYMGKKLNISPLLVILSLFSWGALWGIPGMFLSVPLTVMIMIILSRLPATRSIGVWMSGDGVV